jgi:hypothetical protein
MTIEEYYKILAEKYKKINWKSLESIKAYNEYARTLRKKMIKEEKKYLNKKKMIYCNPDICPHCLYIGEGDSLCEETNKIVLNDWEPTFLCI